MFVTKDNNMNIDIWSSNLVLKYPDLGIICMNIREAGGKFRVATLLHSTIIEMVNITEADSLARLTASPSGLLFQFSQGIYLPSLFCFLHTETNYTCCINTI